LFIIKYPTVLFTALFVLLLSFAQCPQLLVPVGFKRISNQPVFRVDTHVSALCQFGFVPGPFHVLLSQTIGFIEPCLQFLLDGQRDLKCDRIDQFQQYVPDCAVDIGARNTLAQRFGILDPLTLADVFRA